MRSPGEPAAAPREPDLRAGVRRDLIRLVRSSLAEGLAEGGLAAGGAARETLGAWAEKAAKDLFERDATRGETPRTGQDGLLDALVLVAAASDAAIFRDRAPARRVLEAVLDASQRRVALDAPRLYSELFTEQPVLHLAASWPDGAPADGEAALDVVARPGPDVSAAGQQDLVAFSVWAAEAFEGPHAREEEWPWGSGAPWEAAPPWGPWRPAQGLLQAARAAAPNFAFGRYRPRLERDRDGILAIVLRAPAVDRSALVYATRLFALAHRLGRVTLDGQPLAVIGGLRSPSDRAP